MLSMRDRLQKVGKLVHMYALRRNQSQNALRQFPAGMNSKVPTTFIPLHTHYDYNGRFLIN